MSGLVVWPVALLSGHIPENDRLTVSANSRFLQHADGSPFFWLGDTAWEIFHRLDRDEADHYLEDRASKGFTVIQAVAIAELDGIRVPNAYSHLPFVNGDPRCPDVKEGPGNDYWDHVDYVVDKANSLGMWIGFLPTWGRWWHDDDPIFDRYNAEAYGEFVGKRYKDKHVIWILGGDRNIDSDDQKETIERMARGIERGDEGRHLITYHPTGGRGSAEWFHGSSWLDFNMRQNGHNTDYTNVYSKTYDDYRREPVKPVVDGEPLYEDHPISFDAPRNGHSVSADVRRALYWDLFGGAFGHTYGHHSVWQMYDPGKGEGRKPVNGPLMPWREAIEQPGAAQMVHGRRLIESRPFFTRVPMPGAVVPDRVPTAVPGAGRGVFLATGDTDGTWLMVYAPLGREFTVRMDGIKGDRITAWWYDPRTGKAIRAGAFDNDGARTFISPDPGELLDWILVLDDARMNYGAPGKGR